jgi:hypothetical protein
VFLAHTVPVSVALFATAHSRRIAACQGPALALEEDAAKANLARPARDLKLLFSGPDDVTDTWGQVHFGATAMQKIRDCEHPGFTVACCLPRDDGAWDVYGQIFRRGDPASMFEEQHRWELIRAITRDGSHF